MWSTVLFCLLALTHQAVCKYFQSRGFHFISSLCHGYIFNIPELVARKCFIDINLIFCSDVLNSVSPIICAK